MCGIFGVINLNQSLVDTDKVRESAKALMHRGPDDYGTYHSLSGNAFFVHYRLSIIGLSELGRQPMTTEDGRFTILFNGEIYNYKELSNISPFNKEGGLTTNTDTEVLLKLFAHEGESCLNRLRGMFAFVIWDEHEKTLFAARDRFGIKPFYYLHNENEFIFSSEIKAIKKYKDGMLNLDYKGIDSFLRWGSVAPPHTIYKKVKVLPPGCKLKINTALPVLETMKLDAEKWWHFKDLFEAGSTGIHKKKYDNDAKEKIHNAVIDSVKAHMVADVEVGAFLSGGTDSTSIVSLMKQCGHEKIKTISIIFPGNKVDESKYSLLAAKKYNTDHFEYRLQEDEVINEIDNIFDAMDQPTVDGINSYFVSKAAHKFGLKVVLSGLGGDEIFGGYPAFKHIPRIALLKKIPFNKVMMKTLVPVLQKTIPAKAIEYLQNPDSTDSAYRLFRGLFTDDELKDFGWNPVADMDDLPGSSIDKLLPPFGVKLHGIKYTPLQYVSYLESMYYMSNQLLRDSDIFSMAHSLELRVPFVDDRLYSVVLNYIDEGYDADKIKKMLVNTVGDLPDELIKRKKMGFTFPFDDWMKKGKLGKIIKERLLDENYNDFNRQSVTNLFKKYEMGKIHWSRVWALYVLDRFLN